MVAVHTHKDDLLTAIMDAIIIQTDSKEHQRIQTFVHYFYDTQPLENLLKRTVETHVRVLLDLWQFYQHRPSGTPKVNVYIWRPDVQGDVSERLIIDIINDDMSFLVGSLTSLLKRYGLQPKVLLHPIVHVQRDEQGQFITFKNRDDNDNTARDESYIHCEIMESVTQETVEALTLELTTILDEIRLANVDWHDMSYKINDAIADLTAAHEHKSSLETLEIIDFLKWMQTDHFTFLGYCQYDLVSNEGRLLREPLAKQPLGILKKEYLQNLRQLFEGIDYNNTTRRLMLKPTPFLINKASQISNIHRPVLMDAIGIKRFDAKGKPVGIHLFLGLFTSTAYDSSARDIPYLRQKVNAVIEEAGLSLAWHNGKALVHILDSLPRDELFQASIAELKQIGLQVLQLQQLHRLSLFVRRDSFQRFISCLVYIPEDRFNSELVDKIGKILSTQFDGEMSSIKAHFGSLALARVHYIIRISQGLRDDYKIADIETQLMTAARSWQDELRFALFDHYSETRSTALYKTYRSAFTNGYQERFYGLDVIADIEMCEHVYASHTMEARVYAASSDITDTFKLKLFHPHGPLALSDILPTLENLDVRVMTEIPFRLVSNTMPFPLWIHEFELTSRGHCPINLTERGAYFLDVLKRVYHKQCENDGFNRLVLRAGISWRQAELMRAYFRYLKQLNVPFSENTIQNTLVTHPHIIQKFIELFNGFFDPHQQRNTQSNDGQQVLIADIHKLLNKVDASDDDRILRLYLNLITATVRTNFYQVQNDGSPKPCISLKFDCKRIDDMPLPRPLYEIFVYSTTVEAVHLRGGKVARGGIRWSDRTDDFRTEVLGLMKAQMVKNAVIVPVGSKGGFIVKSTLPSAASRDETIAEGIECYKTMMRGMLDITDNLVDNRCVHPDNTVILDGEDPYLVVAADKGTAAFSDHANAVSAEYNFWLDDAFASGGSAGYDHKRMGITARGAWESVKQHFLTLGMNVDKDVIRVVGIGDMSGDVFGNGMLLSSKIKLVAAFNHQHIFIDPEPDVTKSFAERQRLFNLPRTTWQDYNPELISAGGGVFERNSKEIILSNTMQQLLQTSKLSLSPRELIKKLLTLNVDLLWFGGIGTFIKASTESHQDVGDRNNDTVRVNGRELRCRVVAEGANLGVTQLGRIEYNNSVKGRINTDAIDNSAGVDTSDHEVNIKILLRHAMAQGHLTRSERNKLLFSMTDSIGKLVLRDNYLQNVCMNMVEREGIAHLDSDIRLIHTLEKKGKLNRAIEFLPDDTRLAEYHAAQQGLTRPEIAVLMAYAKLNLFEEIMATTLPDEVWLGNTLIRYFPELLRDHYSEGIKSHPLRREIIATCIVNQVVNRTSAGFIDDLQDSTNSNLDDVLRAFLIVVHVFSFEKLWLEIETYDAHIEQPSQLMLYNDLLTILKSTITWVLQNKDHYQDFNSLAAKLSEGMDIFIRDLHKSLDESAEMFLASTQAAYLKLTIQPDFAKRLAILNITASSPDIVLIADKTTMSIHHVAQLYYSVATRFSLSLLRASLKELVITSSWSRLAVNGMLEDLHRYHNSLVIQILQRNNQKLKISEALDHWIEEHKKVVTRYDLLVNEALALPLRDLAALATLLRVLQHLAS